MFTTKKGKLRTLNFYVALWFRATIAGYAMYIERLFEYLSLLALLIVYLFAYCDRPCGLVVRVSGYRYRGPGFDPRRYQIF